MAPSEVLCCEGAAPRGRESSGESGAAAGDDREGELSISISHIRASLYHHHPSLPSQTLLGPPQPRSHPCPLTPDVSSQYIIPLILSRTSSHPLVPPHIPPHPSQPLQTDSYCSRSPPRMFYFPPPHVLLPPCFRLLRSAESFAVKWRRGRRWRRRSSARRREPPSRLPHSSSRRGLITDEPSSWQSRCQDAHRTLAPLHFGRLLLMTMMSSLPHQSSHHQAAIKPSPHLARGRPVIKLRFRTPLSRSAQFLGCPL